MSRPATPGLTAPGLVDSGPAGPAFVHRAGWQHFLPELRGRRVICLTDDRSAVASLVQAGARVQWWPVDEACAAAPSSDPGVPGFDLVKAHLPSAGTVTGAAVTSEGGEGAAGTEVLAVLALAPAAGINRPADWGQRLQARLAQAQAQLAADAWFCWVGSRAHALPALPAAQGWRDIHTRPLLSFGRHLMEVVAPGGYRSTRNRELRRERLKEWVYGPALARWTAPARLRTARRGKAGPVVLDQALAAMARHLGKHPGSRLDSPAEPRILQQQLLAGGKTILTLAFEGQPQVVAVLVGDALSMGRRRAEVDILARLAGLGEAITPLLPRVLGQLEVAGQLCLLLNCLPGVTLDRAVVALPEVTLACVDFLIALQAARSPELVALPPIDPAPLLRPWLASAVARNPQLAAALAALGPAIEALAPAQPQAPVWMHGDFKIENVLYDLKSRRLTGVIDWEHARCPGLPLLDLYYLLTYNRQMAGQDFGTAADELLDPQRRSPVEAKLIQRYCSACGLTPAQVPLLDAAFVLHHLGVRMHGFENSRTVAPALTLLQHLAGRLDLAMASARAGGLMACPAGVAQGTAGPGTAALPSAPESARPAGPWHVPV